MNGKDISRQIRRLVKEIDETATLRWLFMKLNGEKPPFSKLFFAHRSQLFLQMPSSDMFSTRKPFPIRYLFCSNIHLSRSAKDTLKHIAELFSVKVADVESEFGAMFRAMLGPNSSTTRDERFERFQADMETRVKADFLSYMDLLSVGIDASMTNLHKDGTTHMEALLKGTELNKKQYYDMMSKLYDYNLIRSIHVIMLCENCGVKQRTLQTKANISPSHLFRTSEGEPPRALCLSCKNMLHSSAIYRLDDTLLRSIIFHDGMLAVYFAWFLKQNSIDGKYFSHEHQNRYENDFVFEKGTKKTLVECKMYDTSKGLESMENGLVKGVEQIVRHIKETKHADKGFILCNYDLEAREGVVRKVRAHPKFSNDVEQYDIEIVDSSNVRRIVSYLKN